MKNYLALAMILVFSTKAVYANSTDVCPTLSTDSPLEWAFHEGPDFFVCYAVYSLDSKKTAFGVYLGNHPSFVPEKKNIIGEGRVANRKVVWYQPNKNEGGAAFGRQTLIELDRKYGWLALPKILTSLS